MNTINEVKVKCPKCGSGAGYKCSTASGASRPFPHKVRVRLARSKEPTK